MWTARCLRWVATLLALLPAGAAAAALPALAALGTQLGVAESALVVRLDAPRTPVAIAPQRELIPASLTKLYTAAAALQRWGADYRFVTALAYHGRIEGGVLHGDLVFVGAGDPGLTRSRLWELAAAAATQGGVHRVTGDLVIDQSRLGAIACVTTDRCRARQASDHAYNAPLSAAGVDYGAWCVWVRPAPRPGAPARAGLCAPAPSSGVALTGSVRTAGAGSGVHVELWRTTQAGVDTLHLGGSVAAGLPLGRYYVSASDPARLTGLLLRPLLAAQGVHIDGHIRVVSQAQGDLTPLVSVRGATLGHELSVMLHYSNDYMADVLALDLARERVAGSDPPQLAQAGAGLTRFAAVVDRAAASPAGGKAAPVLASGSGLTPSNRLSAANVVALLTRMYHLPALFPAYLAGLSVPRGAPMRMLHGGGRVWLTHTAVKTGSMNDPVSVLAVAGYFRTRGGGWGAFAVIVNGTPQHRHFPWFEAMAAIEHDIGRIAAVGQP